MKKRLHIELAGPVPELGAGVEGVSLKFFAEYAKNLREAYRRAAQGVLTGRLQDEGRVPDRAKEVEIRLVTASKGSLRLELTAEDARAAMQPPLPLVADTLAEDSLEKFFDVLEEAQRSPDSDTLPRAFRVLVGDMSADIRQTYVLTCGTTVLREVVLTSSGFSPQEAPVMAGIRRLPATVRGVIFSPHPAVMLEINRTTMKASATPEMVRSAMEQHERDDLVATIVTSSSGTRLIALSPSSSPFPRRIPSLDETLDRYAEVMAALAK